MLQAMTMSPFVSQHMRLFVSQPSRKDLVALTELVDTNRVAPVIDRICPLSETAEALAYLAHGHARGKVVISV
jgi:NADPH:quinone reductase-like Zn-dependent oxidoreductase